MEQGANFPSVFFYGLKLDDMVVFGILAMGLMIFLVQFRQQFLF